MLGVEHVTSRGSIMLEYYGRNVGVKIMPTGVQPRRLLDILQSDDCKWRRGELQARFSGTLTRDDAPPACALPLTPMHPAEGQLLAHERRADLWLWRDSLHTGRFPQVRVPVAYVLMCCGFTRPRAGPDHGLCHPRCRRSSRGRWC